MLDLATRANNLKLKYLKSRELTTETFNQVIDLIIDAQKLVQGSGESAAVIRDKLSSLLGDTRIDVSAVKGAISIDDIPEFTKPSAEEIRNLLQTLIGDSRLDHSAIRGLNAKNIQFFESRFEGVDDVHGALIWLLEAIQSAPRTDEEIQQVIAEYLEAGDGISIDINEVTGKLTITALPETWSVEFPDPLSVWIVDHPMNKYPAITTMSNTRQKILGVEEWLSLSRVQITFSEPITGLVELN